MAEAKKPTKPSQLDLAGLEDLLKVLRQHGVTHFQNGTLTVTLGPAPKASQPPTQAAPTQANPQPKDEEKVAEEVLFHSAVR